MNVKELLSQSQHWQFDDLTNELLDVVDAVLFNSAPVEEAQDAISHIAEELDCLIDQTTHTHTPTAQDLACRFGGFECQECE
tara:strand:- start:24561 stop:24806 length:246 start_codon:yes stop_codon:yes gene_type:complete